MAINATVYYDYLCPYAFRLCRLLDGIKGDISGGLDISWKTFSLEQQNSRKEPDFLLWEHPEHPTYGILALIAGKAAKNQGQALFLKFHFALFEARHIRHKNISSQEVLIDAAKNSGLDTGQFEADLKKEETMQAMAKDHLSGKTRHNLFGVPSLAFDDENPIYTKLSSLPELKEDRVSLFHLIYESAVKRPCLMEIKRPDPVLL
jgi:predicted DsbA family dithiol-disulfide isomerase